MNRNLSIPASSIFSRANMLPIIFVLFITVSASRQLCNDIDSVDITKGKTLKDGSIQNGVVFPPKYFYSKYVDGEWKTFGCLCKLKNCFRKCCQLGFVMYNRSCTERRDLDEIANSGLDLYDGLNFRGKKTLEQADFGLVFGKPGSNCYLEDPNWLVQENGKLYVETTKGSFTIYGPDQYCIDNFMWDDNSTEISALICFNPPTQEHHYQVSSTCMLISCFFIVLTVAVYAWLPELRNLHGMVMMAYLLSFLVGFTFMATMQIQIINNNIPAVMCTSFTFIIYFSLLSAFFWLNIMCYDIWWTFSGKRSIAGGPSSGRVRFMYYSVYAFGIPLFLTILLAGLEFGLDSNISLLLPRIRLQGCFLFGNSKLLYFYAPIIVLCVANLVFFTLTAVKIAEIKKQTQRVLNKKDKQRFSLYIKLFLVMGVNWILEVVSSFYPQADYIWKFTDAYNVLVGLIIFIIFVCKVKTLKMLRHRYRQQMGLPPLSRTQTTNTSVSTRTCSHSKDEIGMLSVTK